MDLPDGVIPICSTCYTEVEVPDRERTPSSSYQPTHRLSVADLLANNLHCENSSCPVYIEGLDM